MKRIIGVSTLGYPEVRNFAKLPFINFKVKKIQNLHKIPSYLVYKFRNKVHQYHWNSFNDMGLNRYDILHLFNGISYCKKPWVTTFETAIPRWGDVQDYKIQEGINLLASENCKQIIALSQSSRNIQEKFILQHSPDLFKELNNKTRVMYPPQKTYLNNYSEKEVDSNICHMVFLGNQFFSKGGREVLDVLKLYRTKLNIKLTVISNLSTDSYATHTNKDDVNCIKIKLRENSSWITYHKGLQNHRVLEILKTAELALMPSYAETFGYFVLEAQAMGCPLITTDIRALPEINDKEIGWLINVPKDKYGNGILGSKNNTKIFSETIIHGLKLILEQILMDRKLLKSKGQLAMSRILTNNCPSTNASILENEIYN